MNESFFPSSVYHFFINSFDVLAEQEAKKAALEHMTASGEEQKKDE